jgi:lysophospholipase L1-like esterase
MSLIGLALRLTARKSSVSSFDRALAILGPRNGFAISFVDRKMRIQSASSPGLNFTGDPETKLTKFGTDPYDYHPVKGLNLSASRSFGTALGLSLFPFNPLACHVYARFWLNSADSSEQRHLVQVQLTGNDRFAFYTTAGAEFRFVTGNGSTTDTDLSTQPLAGGVERQVFFGCDANGKTFVNNGGIVANEATVLASASPPAFGIGSYNNSAFRVLDGHLAEIVVITEPLVREGRLTLTPVQKVLGCEGDSHTFNVSYGIGETGFYPAQVTAALGPGWTRRNAGTSGDSSAEMVGQLPVFLTGGVPDVASIYCGSNDGDMTVAASPVPTATSFGVSDIARLGLGAWISIGGEQRQISAISGSTVTLAAALAAAPAAGATVVIDTQKNIEHWVVSVKAAGCQKVMVIGSHYLNFASNGDTPTAEQSLRAVMRAKQQAAAAAGGAVYVDTYAAMRDMVLAGQVVQGDDLAWHVAVGDTHLNAAGEAALAVPVRAAIQAQGWV